MPSRVLVPTGLQVDQARAEGVPLALNHFEQIEAVFVPWRLQLRDQCISDFYFSNLYLFRNAHSYRLHETDRSYLSGLTYDGKAHVFPLFDLSDVPVSYLREISRDTDFFYPVVENVVSRLDANQFKFEWIESDSDYCYVADNFRFYLGSLLRKKWYLMGQLLRAFKPTVQTLSRTNLNDGFQVLEAWRSERGIAPLHADEQACREALQCLDAFSMRASVYYVNEIPIGLLIDQQIAENYSVIRFAKGLDKFKGIYQYMFHDYCVRHPALNRLNFEQDMGLANFRQTKRSYQPEKLLKKYRVFLK